MLRIRISFVQMINFMKRKSFISAFSLILLMILMLQTRKKLDVQANSLYLAQFVSECDQNCLDVEKDLLKLAWKNRLNADMMEKSITNEGDLEIFYKLCKTIYVEKRTITFGILGGSASRTRENPTYYSTVAVFVEKLFNVNVEIVNRAIGGMPSVVSAYCLQSMLNVSNIDILLVEFAINDNVAASDIRGRSIEDLIRHFNSLPFREQPFIIFANLISTRILYDPETPNCFNVEEEYFNPVARYYNVAAVSWKRTICDKTHQNLTGFQPSDLSSSDMNHPSENGHLQLGYMISYLLLKLYKSYKPAKITSDFKVHDSPYVKNTSSTNVPLDSRVWLAHPACFIIKHDFEERCNNENNNIHICLEEMRGFEIEKERAKVILVNKDTRGFLKFHCSIDEDMFNLQKRLRVGFTFIMDTEILSPKIIQLKIFYKNISYLSENVDLPPHKYHIGQTFESRPVDLIAREFYVVIQPVNNKTNAFNLNLLALLVGLEDDIDKN
ncbi:unnamed protein product [Owenia fusiformis]|uniref:SGNH hydrolase-type esterase domain-containing protein n=1 Tax=Owenia fusiformis TaxID=6347 RepID=A0A8S4NWW7_OWEFU|nr:unnamed protein product [Owenia fusiformis]